MRRTFVLATVVALIVGFIGAASALSGDSAPQSSTENIVPSVEPPVPEAPPESPPPPRPEAPPEQPEAPPERPETPEAPPESPAPPRPVPEPHDHSTHEHTTRGIPPTPGSDLIPTALFNPAAERLPDNDNAKGLVFDLERPGAQNGSCEEGVEVALPNGRVLCMHNADPDPGG